MFGQNNSDPNQQDAGAQNPMLQNSAPPAGFFNQGAPAAAAPADQGFPPATDQPGQEVQPQQQQDANGAPMIMDDNPTDFAAPSTPEDVAAEADTPESPAPALPAPGSDDLLSMKQEALQHLTPLVQHLDQSPEDKFRTVMMMIQASDDHTKLGEAFELAKQIGDDKARAQALLDVINEINYFTQNNNAS